MQIPFCCCGCIILFKTQNQSRVTGIHWELLLFFLSFLNTPLKTNCCEFTYVNKQKVEHLYCFQACPSEYDDG